MKPWQKGFEMDVLFNYKDVFDSSYNKFAKGPFSLWNNPKIADSLFKSRLFTVSNDSGMVIGYFDSHITKVSTDIVMYFDIVVGKKQKGDRIINAISYDPKVSIDELKMHFSRYIDNLTEPTWFFIFEEDPIQKEIALHCGFEKVGVKISSFSEIYGVYFRESNREGEFSRRVHPTVDLVEYSSMVRIKNFPNFNNLCVSMSDKIRHFESDFANHYSKYNKSKSWGALSVRGYSSDVHMIEKPSCMSENWQNENSDSDFKLQDTELRQKFPEIEDILKYFPECEFDRIRFMKLQPGGGELSRHVDHVEKDSGMKDGQIMRFHIPIITNPKVIFTMWNSNGQKIEQNMKRGETWLFDFRKPHMAVNGGDDIRIHLVIDVIMNERMRDLIRNNL